ncbi:MAG: hypothetical protein LBT08_00160 [Synergistaceae bacterium]|nr:hypothetical protein [Synergistaceae bacterium]
MFDFSEVKDILVVVNESFKNAAGTESDAYMTVYFIAVLAILMLTALSVCLIYHYRNNVKRER